MDAPQPVVLGVAALRSPPARPRGLLAEEVGVRRRRARAARRGRRASTTRPSSSTTIRSASFTVREPVRDDRHVRALAEEAAQPSRISRFGRARRRSRARRRAPARAASAASTRASVTRCFWPPDSVTPRSPTIVSRPCGMSARSRARPGQPATAHGDVAVAVRGAARAKATFSRIVRENRNGSCGTRPTCGAASRAAASARRARRAAPRPASTSKSRGRSWTSVVLPAPVRPTIATVRPAGMVQVDVVEHRRRVRAARVAEGDAAERDLAAERLDRRARPAGRDRAGDGRLHREAARSAAAARPGRAGGPTASSRAPSSARRAGGGSR